MFFIIPCPVGSFTRIPPNQYVFHGAEIFIDKNFSVDDLEDSSACCSGEEEGPTDELDVIDVCSSSSDGSNIPGETISPTRDEESAKAVGTKSDSPSMDEGSKTEREEGGRKGEVGMESTDDDAQSNLSTSKRRRQCSSSNSHATTE